MATSEGMMEMIKTTKLEEFLSLSTIVTHCKKMIECEGCDACKISQMCDFLAENPDNWEIEYDDNSD